MDKQIGSGMMQQFSSNMQRKMDKYIVNFDLFRLAVIIKLDTSFLGLSVYQVFFYFHPFQKVICGG